MTGWPWADGRQTTRVAVGWSARPVQLALLLAGALALALLPPSASPTDAAESAESFAVEGAETGSWTAPFNVGLSAVHSVLLPSGKVLMVSRPRADQPTEARVWDPVSGSSVDVTPASTRDFYCSGHSLLANGLAFYAGGNRHLNDQQGVANTDTFSSQTQSWAAGPLMSQARWYPTNVELPNGNVLMFGGWVRPGEPSKTVEEYDPETNTIKQRPSSATLRVGLYPRIHVLPNGKLFNSAVGPGGTGSTSKTFNPASNTWSTVAPLNFGVRADGNSVQLPGLDKVLAFGGSLKAGSPATRTAEIIDTSAAAPKWANTTPMNIGRKNANAVILPDGTVLTVGGAAGPGAYASPVLQAELFDPETKTWTLLGAQKAPRTYHSTALLLPDGRVLSAGGDRGNYKLTAEIFSPPYLSQGPRPQIGAAPQAVTYGQAFDLTSAEAATIKTISLVKAGSATHATAFDQRYLQLDFTKDGQTLHVTAPPSANHAPPGDYLMFIVDSAGVPSEASWLHID